MCSARLSMRVSSTLFSFAPAESTMSLRRPGSFAQYSSRALLTLSPAPRSPGTMPTAIAALRMPPTALAFSISFMILIVGAFSGWMAAIACSETGLDRMPSDSFLTRSIVLPHRPGLRQRTSERLLARLPAEWVSSQLPQSLRRRPLLSGLPSIESTTPPRPPPWVLRQPLGFLNSPEISTCIALVEALVGEVVGPGVNEACPGAGCAVLVALLVVGP